VKRLDPAPGTQIEGGLDLPAQRRRDQGQRRAPDPDHVVGGHRAAGRAMVADDVPPLRVRADLDACADAVGTRGPQQARHRGKHSPRLGRRHGAAEQEQADEEVEGIARPGGE